MKESIVMCVEDLVQSIKYPHITEKKYLDMLKDQLAQTSGMTITFSDTYKQTIFGKEFVILPVSINDGAELQKFAVCNEDGYLQCIVASYSPSSNETIENILTNNFVALKK